jgi:hypothetical protein
MIENLQLFFKDPAKVNRLVTACFFGAVVLSTYFLFTLHDALVYQGGMIDSGRAGMVYARLFVAIGLAFAFCYATIHYTRKSKKEIIVYLDKKQENISSQQSGDADRAHDSAGLDVKELKGKIAKSKSREEKWQEGINHLCNSLNAGQGALYTVVKKADQKVIELQSSYALVLGEGEKTPSFLWGEGLIGQVAASGNSLYLDELPEGYAKRIESGLGSALPKFLFILPLKKETEVIGVIELATFTPLSESTRKQTVDAGIVLAEIS